MTRLEQLLASVKPKQHEVTIEVSSLTVDQRAFVVRAAEARGLHVSGHGRWLLIRDLRGMWEVE